MIWTVVKLRDYVYNLRLAAIDKVTRDYLSVQIVNYLQENNKNDIKTMSMVNLAAKDLVAIT